METLDEMVREADLIMSILVPSAAEGVAEDVADAMRTTGVSRPFADCNAVSPQTARRMESVINGAGGDYTDGGIIGGSPARERLRAFTLPVPAPVSWTSWMVKA